MKASEKLMKEERETIYLFNEADSCWIADSSIPRDIRQLERKGWEKIDEQLYSDGSIMSARFKAPRKYLSIRQYGESSYVSSRTMSEEHKAKLLNSRNRLKS